jgi:hypothetical protein
MEKIQYVPVAGVELPEALLREHGADRAAETYPGQSIYERPALWRALAEAVKAQAKSSPTE